MNCYEIAVAAPLDHTLTYAHPSSISQHIPIGSCVLVPLGNRKVTGYVVGHIEQEGEQLEYTLKPILQVFEPAPFFPPHLISLYRWIAEYYHHPLGEVIKTALPSAPSAKSGYRALVDKELWQQPGVAEKIAHLQAFPWFQALRENDELTPAAVAQIKKCAVQKAVGRFGAGWPGHSATCGYPVQGETQTGDRLYAGKSRRERSI